MHGEVDQDTPVGEHSESHDHDHDLAGVEEHEHHHGEEHEEPELVKSMIGDIGSGEREITSMLIRYSTPAAIGMFPRLVNQNSSMPAATPALVNARLFPLLGAGIVSLHELAYCILF